MTNSKKLLKLIIKEEVKRVFEEQQSAADLLGDLHAEMQSGESHGSSAPKQNGPTFESLESKFKRGTDKYILQTYDDMGYQQYGYCEDVGIFMPEETWDAIMALPAEEQVKAAASLEADFLSTDGDREIKYYGKGRRRGVFLIGPNFDLSKEPESRAKANGKMRTRKEMNIQLDPRFHQKDLFKKITSAGLSVQRAHGLHSVTARNIGRENIRSH